MVPNSTGRAGLAGHEHHSQSTAPASQQRAVVKPQWREARDKSTGKTYYWHTGTRETRWQVDEPPIVLDLHTQPHYQHSQHKALHRVLSQSQQTQLQRYDTNSQTGSSDLVEQTEQQSQHLRRLSQQDSEKQGSMFANTISSATNQQRRTNSGTKHSEGSAPSKYMHAQDENEESEMLLTQPQHHVHHVQRPQASTILPPSAATAPKSSSSTSTSTSTSTSNTNKLAVQVLLERGVLQPGKSTLALQLRRQQACCTLLQSGNVLGVQGKVHTGLTAWANPLLAAEGLPKLKGQQVANIDIRVTSNGHTLASLLVMAAVEASATQQSVIQNQHQQQDGGGAGQLLGRNKADIGIVATNRPDQATVLVAVAAAAAAATSPTTRHNAAIPWNFVHTVPDDCWEQSPTGTNMSTYMAMFANAT
jgi:hypothetical protein